ncbi:hypothetical protein BDP55DRAFT_721961 [Colletotrichum godetiae]|uniref:Uncharacterized protein n=1 Tax=Colletotrichum godetiae TaxID=1209918 RepID=A0AAJ0A577_9PEZI|nr:uncharacterized protein BDP55DRAFT_721961 [Colletotrichum godetiae]KAK1656712.1 hypothetical protein BDP55DRAFT_721961 [Colletotrichum godetiae]
MALLPKAPREHWDATHAHRPSLTSVRMKLISTFLLSFHASSPTITLSLDNVGINNTNVRRASDPPSILVTRRTRSSILAAKLRLLKSTCSVYTLFTLKRSNDGEAGLQTDDATDAKQREGGTSAVFSSSPVLGAVQRFKCQIGDAITMWT